MPAACCAVLNYPTIAPTPAVVVAMALVVMGLGACSGNDRPPARECGPDITEPLDPTSARHMLPGAAEPVYSSDPPTSGAHLPGAEASGAVRQPLPRPQQVAVLEEGGVMIQYRDQDETARRRLETLAGPGVVVAPNPGLDSPVVATAWRQRLRCQAVDEPTLRSFVTAHRGGGPGTR